MGIDRAPSPYKIETVELNNDQLSNESAGRRRLRVGDGNFDLDARFDGNGGDLLDNL